MYDGSTIDPPRQGQGPRAQSLIDRARQTGGAIHERALLNVLRTRKSLGRGVYSILCIYYVLCIYYGQEYRISSMDVDFAEALWVCGAANVKTATANLMS